MTDAAVGRDRAIASVNALACPPQDDVVQILYFSRCAHRKHAPTQSSELRKMGARFVREPSSAITEKYYRWGSFSRCEEGGPSV